MKEIPFSRFGSYFCVSKESETNEVYICDVHGGDDAPSKLFKVDLLQNGVEQQFDITAPCLNRKSMRALKQEKKIEQLYQEWVENNSENFVRILRLIVLL